MLSVWLRVDLHLQYTNLMNLKDRESAIASDFISTHVSEKQRERLTECLSSQYSLTYWDLDVPEWLW